MVCAFALVTAVAPLAVPTPAEVILSQPTAAEWTRILLAQQSDRDEEIEALEQDMERSRARTRQQEEEQTARQVAEPPPADEAPLFASGDAPGVRGGRRKGYYLAWSIVDWVLAGQLWMSSLVCWMYSAAFSLTASANDAVETGGDEPLGRLSAAFAGAALVFAAGGGLAAWRGGINVATYRELRAQEAAVRLRRR